MIKQFRRDNGDLFCAEIDYKHKIVKVLSRKKLKPIYIQKFYINNGHTYFKFGNEQFDIEDPYVFTPTEIMNKLKNGKCQHYELMHSILKYPDKYNFYRMGTTLKNTGSFFHRQVEEVPCKEKVTVESYGFTTLQLKNADGSITPGYFMLDWAELLQLIIAKKIFVEEA